MKVGHYENGKIVGEPTILVLRIPRTLECESLLSLLRSGQACQISVIDSYGGDCQSQKRPPGTAFQNEYMK